MNLNAISHAVTAWRFTRLGGFDQVELTQASDLSALPNLDPKLWAALSCPTHGVHFAPQTLAFLDRDGDGRIRVPEVLAAVRWVCQVLRDPSDFLSPRAALPLAAIDEHDATGQRLLACAKTVLQNLGKPEADAVTLDDVADITKIFAATRFNGDGIIPARAAEDTLLAQAIDDIMESYGALTDRSGEPGIDRETVLQFATDAQNYVAWWQQCDRQAAQIRTLLEDPEAAVHLLDRLKDKIDDYFTRCRLAAFDARAASLLNPNEASYEQLTGLTLAPDHDHVAALPLATIAADRDLPLSTGVNPAWRDALAQLRRTIIVPLFGDVDALNEAQWLNLLARFADYRDWLAQRPTSPVTVWPIERITSYLEQDVPSQLLRLIEQDLAVHAEASAIDELNQLLHYQRDLYAFLHNFVTFRAFYNTQPHAIFQAGTLYLDGRACHLCVVVEDLAAHSALAELSKLFLVYCTCRRAGHTETLTIAAAVTDGDSDNLRVGRNGVFYDRNGVDWDASIVKLIDHPIGIRQAFWAPYKKVARMINEQLEKIAHAREQAVHEHASQHLDATGQQASAGQPPATAFDVGKFAGIFAAIGLAIGAIGTALATLVSSFLALSWWQMPLAVAGVLLAISGPSMFIAYLKLRQRNLAPLLDACGWAVNAKALINLPFGKSLTDLAKLPKNATRQLADPFGEPPRRWPWYLVGAILLALAVWAWHSGLGWDGESATPHDPAAAEAPSVANTN